MNFCFTDQGKVYIDGQFVCRIEGDLLQMIQEANTRVQYVVDIFFALLGGILAQEVEEFLNPDTKAAAAQKVDLADIIRQVEAEYECVWCQNLPGGCQYLIPDAHRPVGSDGRCTNFRAK